MTRRSRLIVAAFALAAVPALGACTPNPFAAPFGGSGAHVPPGTSWGGNPSTQPPSWGVTPSPTPSPTCTNVRLCWGQH